jgi:hypothetical protein
MRLSKANATPPQRKAFVSTKPATTLQFASLNQTSQQSATQAEVGNAFNIIARFKHRNVCVVSSHVAVLIVCVT